MIFIKWKIIFTDQHVTFSEITVECFLKKIPYKLGDIKQPKIPRIFNEIYFFLEIQNVPIFLCLEAQKSGQFWLNWDDWHM